MLTIANVLSLEWPIKKKKKRASCVIKRLLSFNLRTRCVCVYARARARMSVCVCHIYMYMRMKYIYAKNLYKYRRIVYIINYMARHALLHTHIHITRYIEKYVVVEYLRTSNTCTCRSLHLFSQRERKYIRCIR